MSRSRRRPVALAVATLAAASLASPALAGHDHYVLTPNGSCHRVAHGQTSVADEGHGGYHRFHDNVHIGATGDVGPGDHMLGHGRAAVAVYREGPAPAVCDGD